MKNAMQMTAAERAVDFLASGKNWADYCATHNISSFGDTAAARRCKPFSHATMQALIGRGVVKVVAGKYALAA